MKKILLVICLSAFAILKGGIPVPVIKSFEKKFSDVKEVKWLTHNHLWEATFKKAQTLAKAVFTEDGKWQETAEEINSSQLPGNITEQLHKEYSSAKIKTVWQVDQVNKLWIYRVELEEKGKTQKLEFDKNGVFIKSSKE